MKGFLACCLAMAPQWQNASLAEPVILMISYDEEVGCLAAAQVAQQVQQAGLAPRFAVIGEPTRMQPAHAHKGIRGFRTVVTGLEAHSSQPQIGCNSIHYAVKLVQYLVQRAEHLRESQNEAFTPPYSTLQVGTIEGGTARNIVPGQCSFSWEVRHLPEMDIDSEIAAYHQLCIELQRQMQAEYAGARIVTEPLSSVLPLKPEKDEKLLETMLRLSRSNRFASMAYGTEAGIIQAHGLPCFVCGPGDIAQAHIADEYVELEQLERCLQFLQDCTAELKA